MTWFQILALFGLGCLFLLWLTDKFPNQIGGDGAGAAMISGIVAVVAVFAFIISAIGWAFS